MPLKIDVLRDTQYESDTNGIRAQRACVVSAIGGGSTAPFATLTNALFVAGMPQVNEPHPTIVGCFVIGHRITLESDTVARVVVKYSTPPNNSGNHGKTNQWIIKKRTNLQGTETEVNPANNKPILTSYKNPGDKNDKGTVLTGKVKYLRPARILSATGTFDHDPTTRFEDLIGTVNDANWQKLGVGFWLFHQCESETRDSGKTYEASVGFMSMVNEDWSAYCVQDRGDGKHVVLDQGQVQQIRGQKYTYQKNIVGNGITRVGPYKTSPFRSTFGF